MSTLLAAGGSASASVAFKQPVTLPRVVSGAAPAPPAGFAAVAPLSMVPRGLSSAPSFDGGPIVVLRAESGEISALSLHCCHKAAELSLGDIEDAAGRLSVKCPRHRKKFPGGLTFDCKTGAAWCAGEPQEGAWRNDWGSPGDVAVFETRQDGEWLWASVRPIIERRGPAPSDD